MWKQVGHLIGIFFKPYNHHIRHSEVTIENKYALASRYGPPVQVLPGTIWDIFPACSLHVHFMCAIRSLHVRDTFKSCSPYVQLYVHCTFTFTSCSHSSFTSKLMFNCMFKTLHSLPDLLILSITYVFLVLLLVETLSIAFRSWPEHTFRRHVQPIQLNTEAGL